MRRRDLLRALGAGFGAAVLGMPPQLEGEVVVVYWDEPPPGVLYESTAKLTAMWHEWMRTARQNPWPQRWLAQ